MRSALRSGMRPGLVLLPAVALVLSTLAVGCGSSTPAYCTAATNLKTSVSDLGDVNVAKNGLSSLQTALSNVQAKAKALASEAQSTFAPQITALDSALSGLGTAIKSATGEPSLAAAKAVVTSVTQVKDSASTLQSAVSSKCS